MNWSYVGADIATPGAGLTVWARVKGFAWFCIWETPSIPKIAALL